MAIPLFEGIKLFIILLSKCISPLSTDSKPEIILSSVDFPHPEGPTRTINSPSLILILKLLITLLLPKDFSIFFNSIVAIQLQV